MKAILISIKPKWVEKILNGEKTIELRKTMPKCDLPIDVYIYCTKDKTNHLCKPIEWNMPCPVEYVISGKTAPNSRNGKVVAKFTLNKVEEIYYCDDEHLKPSCLSIHEMFDYLKDKCGYAWHIDNLIIFDKPKELSEFKKYYRSKGYPQNQSWHLTKAPQSWCYVEIEK